MRGWQVTVSWVAPMVAARPRWDGLRTVPGFRSGVPAGLSEAWRWMNWPGIGLAEAERVAWVSVRVISSTGMMVSQSGGRTAPVMICQQWAGLSFSGMGEPAGWRPWMVRGPKERSVERQAMPSIVTRSKGGKSRSATRLSRRVRPNAESKGIFSAGSAEMFSRMKASACEGVMRGFKRV